MTIFGATLRAAQIGLLLLLHGVSYALRWTGLRLSRAPLERRQALLHETLLLLLGGLGATFIKVAQYLSTRPDLLPERICRTLGTLQDAAPPYPYREVWHTLWTELGEPPEQLFADLDPYPVASASIAQVHRGTLADGRKVAVKVLRPGIERTVQVDLFWLRLGARLVALLPGTTTLSPVAVVEQFSDALRRQLDLRVEAENNLRFAQNFAETPGVRVPELCPDLCTRRVLTMSFVEGAGLLQGERDEAEREALARAGYRMLLRMIFVHGFVHADLHPGNLLVAPDGDLVLLDLGVVSELSEQRRDALLRLMAAWLGRNPEAVCGRLLELLPAQDSGAAPAETLRAEVERLLERYATVSLAQTSLGQVLGDLLRLLYRCQLRVDPALTMTILSLGIVEGVGRQLAPNLDLMREAAVAVAEVGIPLSTAAAGV